MQLFDVQSHLDQALLHLTQVEDKKLATITQRFPISLSELIPDEHFAEVAESGIQTLERMVTETEVAGLLEALEGSVAKMMEKRMQPLDSMQEALEADAAEHPRADTTAMRLGGRASLWRQWPRFSTAGCELNAFIPEPHGHEPSPVHAPAAKIYIPATQHPKCSSEHGL